MREHGITDAQRRTLIDFVENLGDLMESVTSLTWRMDMLEKMFRDLVKFGDPENGPEMGAIQVWVEELKDVKERLEKLENESGAKRTG